MLKPITSQFVSKPTWRERRIIRRFQQIYYDSRSAGRPWRHTFWLGTHVLKCPTDLWVYQELIHEVKPDYIIETGTAYGASAHYMATLCDVMGKGKIVTIDIEAQPNRPEHPRLTYLLGSSVSPEIFAQVKQMIANAKNVLVVLDSDHARDHVLAELKLWSEVVTVGSYCIVEDSNVNGHPVYKKYGPGPMEAINAFLKEDNRFEIDRSREKFFMTFNPSGYLKRVR